MASADGRITIEIELEDGTLQRGLADIGNQSDKAGKKTEGAFSKAGTALKKVGKIAAASAAAVTGVALAAGGLAAPLVRAAADAQALNSQFSQVFGELEGTAQKAMNDIAKDTGIMADRMTGSFTMLAAFAKTNGFDTAASLDLSRRAMIAAADGAAFYDKSLEEVTETLQSYLKGNFENDAALGISSTETTRNTAANKLYGKSFKDLAEDQKMLTLLKMVEDGNKLSGALGQAARETDGLENVLGNLSQTWENFKIALGGAILETAIDLLKGLTDVIKNIDTEPLANGLSYIITKLTELYNYLKPIISDMVSYASQAFQTVKSFWESDGESILSTVKSTFSGIYTTIKGVIDKVTPYVTRTLGVLKGFWEKDGKEIFENTKKTFSDIFNTVKNIVNSVIELVGPTIENIAILINKYGARISEVFTAVSTVVLAIINFVLPVVKTLIREAINFVLQIIDGGLSIILGVIDFFVGLFTGDFSKMWEAVKEIFNGAIKLIRAFFTTGFLGYITKMLGKGLDFIKEVFSKAWNFIKDLTSSIFTPIAEFFASTWDSISTKTSEVWESIKTFLSSAWESITTTVSTIWEGVTTFFQTVWDKIVGVFNNVLENIKTTLQGYWDAIGENISSIWESVSTIFDEVWEIIKNIFLGAVLLIYDLVTGNFEDLKSDALAIWDNIVESFSVIWESIKTIFTETLDLIKNFFVETWDNIKTTTSNVFEKIKQFFTDLWNGIVKFFKDTFEKIKKTASESSDNVKKNITEKWEEIKTNVTKKITDLFTNVKKKFTDIYESVKEKMGKVKSFFTDTWDEIKDFAKGIDLFEIGGDIIQGLIDGISSLASNITKTVKKLVGLIPKTIRKVLDINSPSRVTTVLGEYAGEGVVVGLDSTTSSVKRAAIGISKAAIPTGIANRLSGSNVNLGRISGASPQLGTNALNTSTVDNSKSATYNINLQNDKTAELERTLRRIQFAY